MPIDDKERLDARRCDTRVSRGMSCCAMDRDWDFEEEREARLRLAGGETDMLETRFFIIFSRRDVTIVQIVPSSVRSFIVSSLISWDVERMIRGCELLWPRNSPNAPRTLIGRN